MQFAIENAINYDKCHSKKDDDKLACLLDKATVNIGTLFSKQVEGRVSTEVISVSHQEQEVDCAVELMHCPMLPCRGDADVPCALMSSFKALLVLLHRSILAWLTTQVLSASTSAFYKT